MSLNLLTSRKSPPIYPRTTTFVLPSENQNAFRLLSICANAVYNVIQSLKDISSIKIFCLKKEEKTLSEFGSRSDPTGIQERMFHQFKHLGMRKKACKASILSNIRLCRAKADAHEKYLQVSFSAPY